MALSPDDRKRLTEAFNTALERNADTADKPLDLEGLPNPPSFRQVIEKTKSSERFFSSVEQRIAAGEATLDQMVKGIENMKPPSIRKPR